MILRKAQGRQNGQRRDHKVAMELPDEFLDLCEYDMTKPEIVLRGFIADLCGIVSWESSTGTDKYCSNGSDESDYAYAYYDRVGYAFSAQLAREGARAVVGERAQAKTKPEFYGRQELC